jgi:hypothetical protein
MTVKITLITPPDIFQNDNDSILLLNLSEPQQQACSDWLGQYDSDKNYNIYFYQNENNVPWLLHALPTSKYKYINIDRTEGVSLWLLGYILSKPNTYFSTENVDVAEVYSYINTSRVATVEEFFERALGAEKQS